MPILTKWKGYCAWKMLGMGEDLPKNAFLQWRHWCRFRHYFFDDPEMAGIEQRFQSVQTPIVAANALDDLWAMPQSRDAFVKHYSGASVTRLDISPAVLDGSIGHNTSVYSYRGAAGCHFDRLCADALSAAQ